MSILHVLCKKYSVTSKKWSGKVPTKWAPPENMFKQSAEKLASTLKQNSDDLKQAMSRLTFYINRAGSNLSKEDKSRLENAKDKLRALYTITRKKGMME